MLEQTETIVVMLTKVLFEKKVQMLIIANEKKMSGAAGAQSMFCRCAVGALSVRVGAQGGRHLAGSAQVDQSLA